MQLENIYIEELSTIKSLYAVYKKRSQERTIRFFSNKMFLHFFFFFFFVFLKYFKLKKKKKRHVVQYLL